VAIVRKNEGDVQGGNPNWAHSCKCLGQKPLLGYTHAPMKVILTEKPSVAKDIARVLKLSDKKEGYFLGETYAVTWAFGHLVRLVDPDRYDPSFKKWFFPQLPIIPDTFQIEPSQDNGAQKQLNIIKQLFHAETTTEIICATDAGREGELIFRYIYALSGCEKPIHRLWISSQTDAAIREGFDKLKSGAEYEPLYDSARSRSEADWLIGINATRAYTLRFSQNNQGIMSVGRVQTPVLKMIVDRYMANRDFKSETFYEIVLPILHANGSFEGRWLNAAGESRLLDKKEAEAVCARVSGVAQGQILSLVQKQKKESPPLLYDLTELQKEANRKFKLSAEKTLELAQSLYEKHKILTYPRTSSRYLSQDLKPQMAQRMATLSQMSPYGEWVNAIGPLTYPKRVFDDAKVTDHHALIPTENPIRLDQLTREERLIMDLVLKRFIAVFLPDCEKDTTEILSQFGEDRFRSNGVIMTHPGWRQVYLKDEDDKEDEKGEAEGLLPKVAERDAIGHDVPELQTKKTKAPALHNEASILAAMETAGKQVEDEELREAMKDCGLGTPATRAQILERLVSVGYIIKQKNRLIPTEKGIYLIECIQNPALVSPEMTGEWERKLTMMRGRAYAREDYMKEIAAFAREIVEALKPVSLMPTAAPDHAWQCPLCQGKIVENTKAFGCANWREKQCTFTIWKSIAGKELDTAAVRALLETGKTEKITGFMSKAGKPFDAALVLKEGKVVFDF
jgi:DNA topoisomerase-3